MNRIPRFTAHLIALVALIGIALPAHAAMVRVSQESSAGAGDFDANVLGFIDTYTTTLAIGGFYQYNSPDGASYNGDLNGGPAPLSSITQSFFVEASDGLHYVVVHDNPNDGSGGATSMTTLLSGGAGGSTGFTVLDDPGESGATSDVGSDRRFDNTHNWIACCTDGFAIGDLGLTSGFLMFAMFDTTPTGITGWQATGSSNAIALVLQAGREVRFDLAPVPVPAAVWLFASALGVFGYLGKRRRQQV